MADTICLSNLLPARRSEVNAAVGCGLLNDKILLHSGYQSFVFSTNFRLEMAVCGWWDVKSKTSTKRLSSAGLNGRFYQRMLVEGFVTVAVAERDLSSSGQLKHIIIHSVILTPHLGFGPCNSTLTLATTPSTWGCGSQHIDTSNNTKTWTVSQHTDTEQNAKSWAVTAH